MSKLMIRVGVKSEEDVSFIVLWMQHHAAECGFNTAETNQLSTTVSELGYNILHHAGQGNLIVRALEDRYKQGLSIEAHDSGPGIANIAEAMREHTSTRGSLGLGLPGVQRMMDELNIESTLGAGTRVTVKKWLRKNG